MWAYLESVFANVIKDLEMRSSLIIPVGLKSNYKHPYKRHSEERGTQRNMPCEDRSGYWSHVVTSQETPGVTKS